MSDVKIGDKVRLTAKGRETLVNDLDGPAEFSHAKGEVDGFDVDGDGLDLVVVTLYSTVDDHSSEFTFHIDEIEVIDD